MLFLQLGQCDASDGSWPEAAHCDSLYPLGMFYMHCVLLSSTNRRLKTVKLTHIYLITKKHTSERRNSIWFVNSSQTYRGTFNDIFVKFPNFMILPSTSILAETVILLDTVIQPETVIKPETMIFLETAYKPLFKLNWFKISWLTKKATFCQKLWFYHIPWFCQKPWFS